MFFHPIPIASCPRMVLVERRTRYPSAVPYPPDLLTPVPVPTNTSDWTTQEIDLLDDLVQFQCKSNHYNQLASLYFTPADTAMQQLFHFKEVDGTTYTTFDTGKARPVLIG